MIGARGPSSAQATVGALSRSLLLPGPALCALLFVFGAPALSGPGHGFRVLLIVLIAIAPWWLWMRWAPVDEARRADSDPPWRLAGSEGALEPATDPGLRADADPRLQFVASMGHDLRSPLNAMLGFADLLQMTAGPDDEAQAGSVEVIRQRTGDLLVLIDDMLMWAKLESGGLRLSPSDESVNALLQRAAALAIERSGARGLEVRCHAPTSLPAVRVDAERVVQAIVALLHDAVVANRPAPVQFSAHVTRQGVRIEVQVPDLLIRSADKEAFFEPFRPSFAPSGQRVAGLGVGVACARAFIHAHGGELSLTTGTQRGTTFAMVLPLAGG